MKRLSIRLFVLSLTLLSSSTRAFVVVPAREAGLDPVKLAAVRERVAALVDTNRVGGASVLIARGDRVGFCQTVGWQDRAAGRALARDTIFRFYSMTKPITVVAALMLYDEGKLALDEPVATYLPALGDLRVYREAGSPVPCERAMTVRDLMRHTSGLTYGFFGDTPVDRLYRQRNVLDRDSSLEAMITKLAGIPLLYQPGTRWHYGVSTDVLGALIERVSGQALDRFFRERIFTPLGMTDTGFSVPPEKVARFAVCYGPTPAGGLAIRDDPRDSEFRRDPGLRSGGGGLVSTLGDYLRFCRLLLRGGVTPEGRLLRAETVAAMTRNQLPEAVTWNGQGFGLGVSVRTRDTRFGPGEYGWGGAASTHFWIHPGHDLIVIALSQIMPFTDQLQRAVRVPIYEALVD